MSFLGFWCFSTLLTTAFEFRYYTNCFTKKSLASFGMCTQRSLQKLYWPDVAYCVGFVYSLGCPGDHFWVQVISSQDE